MSTNRIIELCLVFLISVLSFSIGTFVGKKYSDNQHKLALLDPQYNKNLQKSENAEHKEIADTAVPNSNMTDEEIAKMSKEFSEEDDHITSTDKTAAHTTNDKITEKEDNSNLVKTIEEDGTVAEENLKPIAKNMPSKTIEKKADPQALKRDVATIAEKVKSITSDGKNAKYTVQIGSFPSPSEADKIVNSLQARGYKATQVQANVNGKTWHRVQVGLFTNLEEAQAYKKELVEQNRLTTAIISKITE